MDPDKQMVRWPMEEGWVNLSIGEPIFLQKHLSEEKRFPKPGVSYGSHFGGECYPPYMGQPDLLKTLHLKHPGKHVVVTNGAKQALLAAIYATTYIKRVGGISHSAPHWPSYPTLAMLSGSGFFVDPDNRDFITYYVSSPNNPDGKEWQGEPCDVWDAAYAHSVYGWSGTIPDHRISVWSAAKMFGLSGERVGWAVTADEELANKMADYVEKTTSGVNIHAQQRVAYIVGSYAGFLDKEYNEARVDLLRNAYEFNYWIRPHCDVVEGTPTSSIGMFAWFKAKDAKTFRLALERAMILVVDGKACGATEDGWFRMSMGQSPEVNREALTRLGTELDNG